MDVALDGLHPNALDMGPSQTAVCGNQCAMLTKQV